jgi:phosphoribosylanthranilate isomerase
MTLVKVCGITNLDDALACAEIGADLLGFIFAESPRRVDVEVAREIIETLRSGLTSPAVVGVFTEESHEVLRIAKECQLDYVQLHGGQSDSFAAEIGADRVIRVGRIKDQASVDALAEYPSSKFFLLDTYREGIAGGTGETFDWELAVKAKTIGKPIILSGGLNPDNVFDAVRAVRPFAVDVSSGVELSPGKKDIAKVKEFIDHVREADNAA